MSKYMNASPEFIEYFRKRSLNHTLAIPWQQCLNLVNRFSIWQIDKNVFQLSIRLQAIRFCRFDEAV